MLVLGIVLVAVAAALVVAALFGGADQSASFDLGAVSIDTTTFSAFLAGAVTLVVLVAGLGLIQSGVRRARRRRHDKKELDRLSKKEEAQESSTTTQPGTTRTRAPESRPEAGGDASTEVTDPDRRTQ
jgi:membrane protein implicated in regulation of membrane protease activity